MAQNLFLGTPGRFYGTPTLCRGTLVEKHVRFQNLAKLHFYFFIGEKYLDKSKLDKHLFSFVITVTFFKH